MKKLSLLSAVALALTACGGGSKDLVPDEVQTIKVGGGIYKADAKWSLGGHPQGIHETDVQAMRSPYNRDGVIIGNHAALVLETRPTGFVEAKLAGQESAPLNSGMAYYKGIILHAGLGLQDSAKDISKSYDVSSGRMNLDVDFTNKKFKGGAENVEVVVADHVRHMVQKEVETKDAAGTTTKTTSWEDAGLTPTLTKDVIAMRTYTFEGDVLSTGLDGKVTMVNTPYITTSTQYANATGSSTATGNDYTLVSVPDPNTPVTKLENGRITGKFFGPNAEEVAGEIKFLGSSSQYNAGFIAERSK